MCHRRGEWSRTSSSVTEPADEPKKRDPDREWWGARARERLVALVPFGRGEAETPARPAAEPRTTWAKSTASEFAEETDEAQLDDPTEKSGPDDPTDEPDGVADEAEEPETEEREEPIPAHD